MTNIPMLIVIIALFVLIILSTILLLKFIDKKFIKEAIADKRTTVSELKDAYEDADRLEIMKSIRLLDLFTKTFCRYPNDYKRFNDLKFRCDDCPFQHDTDKIEGACMVKEFKCKFAPDYIDFGSMGDL